MPLFAVQAYDQYTKDAGPHHTQQRKGKDAWENEKDYKIVSHIHLWNTKCYTRHKPYQMKLPITLEIPDITTEIKIPDFNQTIQVERFNLCAEGPWDSDETAHLFDLPCSSHPGQSCRLTWKVERHRVGILLAWLFVVLFCDSFCYFFFFLFPHASARWIDSES